MKNRRRLAALFALIALVFSFAETTHASACELAAVSTHAQHQMPGHTPSHQQSMPNCPFSAAGQAGCTSTVSIHTTYTEIAAPAHEVATSFASDVVLPHAERTTAIFHPPRF